MIRAPIILSAFAAVMAIVIIQPAPAVALAAQATAQVRLVHMSPGTPSLDLKADGQTVLPDLAFKSASAYIPLTAGMHHLQLTSTQQQPPLVEADLPLREGQALTLVVVGRQPDVSLFPLEDNNQPPPAGKAKVRFMHTSPDAPAVDVTVRNGPVLFPRVAFKNVADYVSVDAGTYALDVRPSGATTVALTVPSITLQSGQVVTIFATGLLATNSLTAVGVVYAGSGDLQPLVVVPRVGVGVAREDAGGAWQASVAGGGLLVLLMLLLMVRTRRRVGGAVVDADGPSARPAPPSPSPASSVAASAWIRRIRR
jgi:hypothetical protein